MGASRPHPAQGVARVSVPTHAPFAGICSSEPRLCLQKRFGALPRGLALFLPLVITLNTAPLWVRAAPVPVPTKQSAEPVKSSLESSRFASERETLMEKVRGACRGCGIFNTRNEITLGTVI